MPTNTVKFKVFGEGYEKLNSTHPSGISYTLGFCLPIYDSAFDLNNGGTIDVSDPDFKSEDGMTNLDWFAQYENINAGVFTGFNGDQLYLVGSYDSENQYTRADQYTLDGDLLNVAGNLLPQKDLSAMVTGDFWKVYPYYPLNAQGTSGNVSAGTYEATIAGDAGDFTFNKLAVFVKELDSNGNETGVFHLFGIVYSNVKLIKRFNNDPEAYNPAFKIKLNVVVSDLTTSDPYDDYVFINDGYWNLISSDTISTLFHTVSKNGNPIYNSRYRKVASTHYKKNSDPFGSSQESITEPSVNGDRLLSMSRYPIWSLYDAGIGNDEREMRNILYNFNIFDPSSPSEGLDDVITSIVYGSRSQLVESRRSFVFETRDDDVAQLPNKIVSRYHFGNGLDGGGNLVFGRGVWATLKNSFIFERGGFDPENYESIFYADYSRSFGARNRMGFWSGDHNAYLSKYGDIFGEDNLFVGVFGHIIGQCNSMNNSYSSIVGNKNEIGINDQIPQNYVNLKERGEYHTRLSNVNVHVYGDTNFLNATNSWNSGLDLAMNGVDFLNSPWTNQSWLAFREARATDISVFGSFNNILGSFQNVLASVSNSFVRGNLHTGGTGELTTVDNTTYGSILFGMGGSFSNATNSLVGANNRGVISGSSLFGMAFDDSQINGYASMGLVGGNSKMTTVFSMVNINANNITGGYPTVWRDREGYTYSGDVATMRDHKWAQSILNGSGNDYDIGDYGQYPNDNNGAYESNVFVAFEWWSLIGRQVVSGSPNATYGREICLIYHVGTDEQLVDSSVDPEGINDFMATVYMPHGGTWATHLINNFGNENNWFMYLPIRNKRTTMVRIQSVNVIDVNGTDYVKIDYVNPINLSTTKNNAQREPTDGVFQIEYGSNNHTFSNNLLAFIEVEDSNLQAFLASNDVQIHTVLGGIPALDNATEDTFLTSKTDYAYNSVVNASSGSRVKSANNSVVVGTGLRQVGRVSDSNIVGSGIYLFANHRGLDIVGDDIFYEFKLGTHPYAKAHFGYDGDLTDESDFRKYHAFISNDGYDSYHEFFRGTDIRVKHSERGFGAFNFYYGSKIDVGDSLIEEMVGSTGQMYNFVFGHNIKISSDSGLYGSNDIGKKYANNNLTAMGINLLLSRSDQFVFGRNNTGDPSNLFEFGIGLHYEDPDQNSRQNGFAFGYIYDGYELASESDNEAHALYPAFKIETSYLFLGAENRGVVCKMHKASISSPEHVIGVGDLVYAIANNEDVDSVDIEGGELVVNHLPNADLTKMRVGKFSDTELDWTVAFLQGGIIGVAMSAQTLDGGDVLIGVMGGPFEVLRNHSEWPTDIPEKVQIISTKKDYPYVGGRTFQVYLN